MGLYVFLLLLYIELLVLFERYFNRAEGRKFRVSFSNYFFVALIAYTVLPMVDCIFNNKHIEYIGTFLFKCILMLVCLFIGYILGDKSVNKTKLDNRQMLHYLSKGGQLFWTFFWGCIVIGFVFINVILNRGGVSNALNASYRESYVSSENSNIAALLYSSMPYAMIFNDKRLISNKSAKFMALIITMVCILLNFFLGNRNLAVMICLALIWTALREKRFSKIFVYGSMIVAIVFLGIVAVMREYSILRVLSGAVSIDWKLAKEYAFAFSNGELGTTFAFERYKDNIVDGFAFPYRYGYSYLVLPILNLVPTSIWHGKPAVFANYFSHYAFGSFDGLGYGFSPIYEAEVNFSYLWWIVFGVVGFALARFNKVEEHDVNNYYNVGLAACIVLNFFRIDFSTCFKFYAMMWVFKWIYMYSFRFVVGHNHCRRISS